MGIKELVTAPRSPWQNPYVERLIGSIRRECLDHIIIFNQCHLRSVLSSYFNIIMRPELIFRSTRIAHNLAVYSLHQQARSSPSRKRAVCIIATNVAPRDLEVGEPARPCSDLKDRFHHIAVPNGVQKFRCILLRSRMPRCTC
jgi:hypothetical protein